MLGRMRKAVGKEPGVLSHLVVVPDRPDALARGPSP